MKDLSFWLEGQRRKGIVLVHGLTGSPAEMKYLARQMNNSGATVYAPTLAGHGLDKEALIATTYEDWLNSVHVAIRSMAEVVDQVYVAGICVGGLLGLQASMLEEQTVHGVVLYSPTLHYDGWSIPLWKRLSSRALPLMALLPQVANRSIVENYPYGVKWDRLRNFFSSGGDIDGALPEFPISALYQHRRLAKDLRRALPDMRVPTLLVHSAEDDISNLRNSLTVQKWHGGDCRLEILEDSYHMMHIDQERHVVARLTADMCGLP